MNNLGLNEPPFLLTIFSQGRNDGYMGNFTWRLATALNNHARNIRYLDAYAKVEVLVTDWGSEQPLYEVLDLTDEARSIVKFLMVPPALAKQFDGDSEYSFIHPLNAAARRAQGKYVLFSDSDVFITLDSMTKLLHHLKKGRIGEFGLDTTFFWASRYHIPQYVTQHSPSIRIIDQLVDEAWTSFETEPLDKKKFHGSGVCLLTSRDMWHESTGWDEQMIYWGWFDIDLHERLRSRYDWADLSELGMKMFHLEHYFARSLHSYNMDKPERRINPDTPPRGYAPNPPNWGLADYQLEVRNGWGELLPPHYAPSPGDERRYAEMQLTEMPHSVAEIVNTRESYRRDRLPKPQHRRNYCFPALAPLLEATTSPRLVCEIGSGLGSTSTLFARGASTERVYCVDTWDAREYRDDLRPIVGEFDKLYEQFLSHSIADGVENKIYPLRMTNDAARTLFRRMGMRFDVISVKSPSSTLSLGREIERWIPFLSSGGAICADKIDKDCDQDRVALMMREIEQRHGLTTLAANGFWLVMTLPAREKIVGLLDPEAARLWQRLN